MDDKIDGIIELLGTNKKSIVAIYIIVMVAVVVFIWWPRPKEYTTYERVDMSAKKTELAQNYVNVLTDLFTNSKTEEVKDLISSRYTSYMEKNSDEIIKELQDDGFFSKDAVIRGVDVYEDEDTYIYSTTIYAGNKSKRVNLVEREPYNYLIVFDDFYSYETSYNTTTTDNIKFTINSIYSNLKYVEIDMSIENLNDTDVKFNFNNIKGVQAVLEDGTKYPISNLVSNQDVTNVQPNKTINKTLVFDIPAQLQGKLKSILFNNVSVKYAVKNLKVTF